jgi:membrane dipeptidase
MYYLDTHVDTITNVMEKNRELYDNDGHLSLKRLEGFDASVIFFAVYLHKENNAGISLFDKFKEIYAFLQNQINKNAGIAELALSLADIGKHIKGGMISAVPAIEEGAILEGKMENLYKAAELGVRYITLTWNFPNEIGEPSAINGGGLTPFGKDLLRGMEGLGVLADVSHLSL